MATNNVKRKFKEKGVVISKYIKPETKEFTGQDGKTVQAQPERHFIKTVTSSEFNKECGYGDALVTDFRITPELYNQCLYMTQVNIECEFSSYGIKPLNVEILAPKQ